MAGGFVVARDGEIAGRVPLPIAGLLSTEPAKIVCEQLTAIRRAAADLGSKLACPFGTLSFLALPVIPVLKITGLVEGFGFHSRGAIGSSVAHDSHNLIIAGTNPRDMLTCAIELERMAGGFVVARDGEIAGRVPLPIAGLLSTEPAKIVCEQLTAIRRAAADLGSKLACPFGTLSFLALPVIPVLKITDQGLFDVTSQQFIKL